MVDRKWVTLSNTTVGTFMALLDTSIVLVSLPTIGRELPGTDPAVLLWVVLSYNVVTTTLLLSFGRLSDMFGRVRLYTLGFAVFTVGSLFASLAPDGTTLLAARIVQGVGAGFLSSNAAAILTDAFPARERGRALGLNQVAAITGSMAGLILGGILTTELGWRSIFWVNLPIGVFGTLWAYYQLVETHAPERHARIDWAGNVTFGLGLTLALVGITLGALNGWGQPVVLAALVVAPVLLAAFVQIERTRRHPMFDLALFRIRTFVFGNLAAGLSALARGAFTFMMIFYFQGVLALNAERAGLLLLPLSIAFAIAGPISGTVSDRTGARYLGTVGLLVSVGGFALLIGFPANGPYLELAVAMVLLGVGQGMFAAPNRAEVMSSVPADRRGIAAGTGTTFLNGGMLGSLALGFTVLAGVVPHGTLEVVFSGRSVGNALDVGAFMSALHLLFTIAFFLTLAAAAMNLLRGQRTRSEEFDPEVPAPRAADAPR
ncbi:MAG: MFS transporter [Thermoplasmata archaeon]|nr:MFS transporter [Thermoplasmata archaeon]